MSQFSLLAGCLAVFMLAQSMLVQRRRYLTIAVAVVEIRTVCVDLRVQKEDIRYTDTIRHGNCLAVIIVFESIEFLSDVSVNGLKQASIPFT